MCEQAVERTPAVQNMSFTASGIPSSGPPLPCAIRVSDAFAIAVARSGVSSTKTLSTRAFSIEAWCAAANSTAEKDFFFSPSRASANVSDVSSLTARLISGSRHVATFTHGWFTGLARESGRRRPLSCPARSPLRLESVEHRQVSELAGDAHWLLRHGRARFDHSRLAGRDPRVSRCPHGDGIMGME